MKTACTIAATLALAAGFACAADYAWTNAATANQEWNVAENWSPNGLPDGTADTVLFTDMDTQAVQRTINQSGYDVTIRALHIVAETNRYTIATDAAWGGKMMTMQAPSGHAVIEVKSFADTGAGAYFAQLRLQSGAGALQIVSDTDITLTNGPSNITYASIACPLAGSGAVNVYGNGFLTLPGGESPYTGTINLYTGYTVLPNNPEALTNAAGIVVHSGAKLDLGGQYTAGIDHNALLVLNGGQLNNGAGWHYLKNVRVTKDSNIDPGWWNTIFNGTIQGTGTVNAVNNGSLSVIGCTIKPGFSTGILNFNRTGADFTFGSNTLPVTLAIDISGSGGEPGVDYDQVNVTGVQAGRDVDLTNVNVAFTGAGGSAVTNWFFAADLLVNGSLLRNVNFGLGTGGTIIYDYANNRIGAVVIPEPGVLGGLIYLGYWLARKQRA